VAMKKLREEVISTFKLRLEFIKFMEENLCSTALWKDYLDVLELPKKFEQFLEQLEQLIHDREVLYFRDHLKHYPEFQGEYTRLSFLGKIDDDQIKYNYEVYFKDIRVTKPVF